MWVLRASVLTLSAYLSAVPKVVGPTDDLT